MEGKVRWQLGASTRGAVSMSTGQHLLAGEDALHLLDLSLDSNISSRRGPHDARRRLPRRRYSNHHKQTTGLLVVASSDKIYPLTPTVAIWVQL